MRFLLLGLLLALAAFAQDGYPRYETGFVTGDEVHMRAGPGKDAPIVANLRRGDMLAVIGSKGGWTEVIPSQVYVRADALDAERKVKGGGATLLWEPRADAPVLGPVEAGVELWGVPGKGEYVRVLAPATPRYYVADQFVQLHGVPARPAEIVEARLMGLPAADLAKLRRLKDLKMLVLPVDVDVAPRLVSADTGRFGPSYEVKYQVGAQWFKVSGATGGLGGPDVSDVLYTIQTPLLGRVIVGPTDYGGSNDLMMIGPGLSGASTLQGKPTALTVFFSASPKLDERLIRQALTNLRAARL